MVHSNDRSIFSFFLFVEKNSSVIYENFCYAESWYSDRVLQERGKDRMMIRMKKRIFPVAVSRGFSL